MMHLAFAAREESKGDYKSIAEFWQAAEKKFL